MRTKIRMSVVVGLAAITLAASGICQGGWENVMSKNGIKVFTRPVSGSEFDEFKGVTTINVDINVIDRVLSDVPSATQWMHNCIKAELLERTDDKIVLYQVTKAPWPASNRDLVIESKRTASGDRIVREMRAVKHPKAPKKTDELVRVPRLKGTWTLTKKGNATHVVYQIQMDPGGKLPTWLTNSGSKDLPFHTLTGLKKIVKQAKYQK